MVERVSEILETSDAEGTIIHVDGYRYRKQEVRDGATRWLCTFNKAINCPAAIYSYTEDKSVLKRVEKHNHSEYYIIDTLKETADTKQKEICDDDDEPAADNSGFEQVEIHQSESKLSPEEDEECMSDNPENIHNEVSEIFETSYEDCPIMLVDGYRYSKQKVLDGETRWLCTFNKTNGCPAAIYSYTEDHSVLKRVEKHNHSRNESILSTQEEVEHEKNVCDDDVNTAAHGTNTVDKSSVEQIENHVNKTNLTSTEENNLDIHENSNVEGLTFCNGRRGGICLCLDGYRYHKESKGRTRSNKIWWRCCSRISKKCKAYVVTTIEHKFISRSGQHNHTRETNDNNHEEPIFATSKGGDTTMHLNGHKYFKHQTDGDGETRWLCVSYKTHNCQGAIYSYTEDNSVLKLVEKHNHPRNKSMKKIKKDCVDVTKNETKCDDDDPLATGTDTNAVDNGNIPNHEKVNTDVVEMTFERSRVGGTSLRLDGFTFSKDGEKNEKTTWRCSYRKRHKCKAMVVTIATEDDIKIFRRSGQHNHLANGKKEEDNCDEDDKFRWETSCYGNPLIRYKGNRFNVKAKIARKTFWSCSRSRSLGCRATITTVDKTVVKCKDNHNH